MMLSSVISLARSILKAEDPAVEITDSELGVHIARAVALYSQYSPRYKLVTRPTVAGERSVDISALADRIVVEGVEYPLGQVPKSFPRFRVWGDTLVILSGPVSAGDNCRIYYGALHELSDGVCTIPQIHVSLVALGAAAYAALALARLAVNSVNTGGGDVADRYLRWGTQQFERFQEALKRISTRSRLGVFQLYAGVN